MTEINIIRKSLLDEDNDLRLEDRVEDALTLARQGNKIREKRITLGLSQIKMADLIGETQATYSRIETGQIRPDEVIS